MKRNMDQWTKDLLAAETKKAVPVLSFPSIQLLGITVKDLISDSDLQARGMKAVADRTDAGAAVSLMDLSLEAECFGAPIRVSDDEVPTVTGPVISTEVEEDERMAQAEALAVPEIGAGRTQIYIDAIEKAKKRITDRPVLAGIIGPYTLAGRLIGMSEIMMASITDPAMVQTVLEKATEFIIAYARAYRDAGADGFVMAEPTTGLISPKLARKLSHPYTKAVIDAVQTREYIVVYHNCGESVVKMTEDMSAFHAEGYHFGNCINMADILPHLPADSLVMGNVAPAEQFCVGTPEGITENTREILEACDKYPNFVISSGCDMPPTCNWDCIDAFFAEVTRFYQQKVK